LNRPACQRTLRAIAERKGSEPVIGDVPNATSAVLVVVNLLSAGLLVAAGGSKIVRPEPTARALYAAGLRGRNLTGRAVGIVELAVGLSALTMPTVATESALAATYLAFAVFLGFLLLARPGTGSCGCAGTKDVPPSLLHVALNVVAAAAATGAAFALPPGLGALAVSLGWAAVPYAAGMVAAGLLVATVVADMPAAFRSYRRPSGHAVERGPDRHARADAALVAAGIGPGHPSLWPDALAEGSDG
jgi:methylamine utilization protein MauE